MELASLLDNRPVTSLMKLFLIQRINCTSRCSFGGFQSRSRNLSCGAAASPAATINNEFVDPTYVPRSQGVKDGLWSKVDSGLVDLALKDMKSSDKSELILLGKSAQDLSALAERHQQPGFRGKQLLDGVLKGARSIEDIKVSLTGL